MRIPEIGKQRLEATRISMSSSEETELIGRTPTTRRQGSVYVIVSDSHIALGGSALEDVHNNRNHGYRRLDTRYARGIFNDPNKEQLIPKIFLLLLSLWVFSGHNPVRNLG